MKKYWERYKKWVNKEPSERPAKIVVTVTFTSIVIMLIISIFN